MQLVTFSLKPIAGGCRLTVMESGFEQIPEQRRVEAFRMNDGGWTAQMENIADYLAEHP